MRRALTSALVVLAAGAVFAQQPTFRSSGNVTVSVPATALDNDGRIITDLERHEFTVFDNGRPQEITVFANGVEPFTIVVMLDFSASMTAHLDLLKAATEQFIIRMLPEDRGQVGAFSDKIQFSGEFTNDRDALISALDDLQFGNPTRLHDAIYESMAMLTSVSGRRVVLVFTDGDDTASRRSFDDVMERAVEEGVMIYAIGLQSEFFNGQRVQRTRPSRALRRLAEETGGGYFELTKTDELGPTFTRVSQELHSLYTLGFTPAELDGEEHRLEVRVSRPGVKVRARRSYIAIPERRIETR